MKKSLFLAATAFFIIYMPISFADSDPLPMNQISMSMVKEQWATTNTAKVVVNVAAVLDAAGLAKTHQIINDKLKKISDKGEWHITQFNRMKDPSGLEKLNVRAEARVPEGDLAPLRDRVKSVSVPGAKYTIVAIQFTPSLEDIQKTRAALRSAIFAQVKEELSRINKAFGEQKYFLHNINFIPMIMPVAKQLPRMMMTAQAMPEGGLVVSDKVTETASVVFASKND